VVARKKPMGKDWDKFVERWNIGNHQTKVALALEAGVTYDTFKHWISESCASPKVEEPKATVDVSELLGMRPAVNLDFVTFDIETSNLNADFSVLLSAVIKPFGQPPICFRADSYESWATRRSDDSEITRDIAQELSRHAIVITHYGSEFDIKFMRAKMLKHGLPVLPPMFALDTWKIACNNFKVSRRSLVNLAKFFDVGDKEGVEGGKWMTAAYDGDSKAMDDILAHNIVDCEILERLSCLVFPFIKSIPRM
jgi:uncharacterized protein YprB with RNaseH-like and TPR domain